jgi:hypothetical protein
MTHQNLRTTINFDVATAEFSRYQRSAKYSGLEFSDWARKVLAAESERILAFEDKVEPQFEIPLWATGLSVRTVKVLAAAGITTKEQLIQWFNEHSETDIKEYPNSGNYVYKELCMWMNA